MFRAMTVVLTLVVISVATSGSANEAQSALVESSGEAVAGWRLSASAEAASVDAGEPVVLSVRLENGSDQSAVLWISEDVLDYEMQVTGPLGKPTPLTLWGQSLDVCRATYSRNIKVELGPGQELKGSILISRAFDMSLSGTYTITLTRRVTVGSETLAPTCTLKVTVAETQRPPDLRSEIDS